MQPAGRAVSTLIAGATSVGLAVACAWRPSGAAAAEPGSTVCARSGEVDSLGRLVAVVRSLPTAVQARARVFIADAIAERRAALGDDVADIVNEQLQADLRDGLAAYVSEALDYADTALAANQAEVSNYLGHEDALHALADRLTRDAAVVRQIVRRVQLAYRALRGESGLWTIDEALAAGAISPVEASQLRDDPDGLRALYEGRLRDTFTRNEDNAEVALYHAIQARSPVLWSREPTLNPLATTESTFLYNALDDTASANRTRLHETLLRIQDNIAELQVELSEAREDSPQWTVDGIPDILTYDNVRQALMRSATGADLVRLQILDALVDNEIERDRRASATSRAVIQIGGTAVGVGALLLGQPEIAIPAFALAGGVSTAHTVDLYFREEDLRRRTETGVTAEGLVSLEASLRAQSEFDAEIYWALLDAVDVAGGVASVPRLARLLRSGRAAATLDPRAATDLAQETLRQARRPSPQALEDRLSHRPTSPLAPDAHAARTLQDTLQNRERIREAFERAGVPHSFAAVPHTRGEPTGDFYTVTHSDGDLTILVGDVVDHGTRAGNESNHTHRALDEIVSAAAPRDTAATIMQRADAAYEEAGLVEGLALNVVRYSPVTGRVQVRGAGAEPVFVLRRSGKVEAILPEGGLDLGSGFPVGDEVTSIQLEPGDKLIVLTDGITEAIPVTPGTDTPRSAFVQLLSETASDATPADVERAILDALPGPLHDDATLLILEQP